MRVKETNVDATLQACVQNVPKKKSNYVTANLSNALEAQISISYLKMLGYFFLPTLHEKLESAYKVKDFGRNVKSVLKWKVPERWIGRGGPVNWPARSPDLNTCVCVCGFLITLIVMNVDFVNM